MTVIAHFEQRARVCDQQGAHFTAALMRAIARSASTDTQCGTLILNWPSRPDTDALALRACSALHLLSLRGSCPDLMGCFPPNRCTDEHLLKTVQNTMKRFDSFIAERLKVPPQTNEINRCAILVAALARISRDMALPLDVIELGASGGLNLLFNEFTYRFRDGQQETPGSDLAITPEMLGSVPDLSEPFEVRSAEGCDLYPIDVTTDDGATELMSFVWPDQHVRLHRLQHAIEVARTHRPIVWRESADRFLERKLADRPDGACLVVFSSLFWQFASDDVQRSIKTSLDLHGKEATSSRPFAWIEIEGQGKHSTLVDTTLRYWPGQNSIRLAESDYHASRIRFF